MRAVIQRVKNARVEVDNRVTGKIGWGILVLLGIGREDDQRDADYVIDKSINLRIFEDAEGKMNLSLLDIRGEMLIISQFTVMADCRKGRRPSFIAAEDPDKANDLYRYFIEQTKERGVFVSTGKFQSLMEVTLVNHGPVTILIDSKKVF